MPEICLVPAAKSWDETRKVLGKQLPFCGMAEIRLDLLTESRQEIIEGTASFFRTKAAKALDIILTCRLPEDGGAWQGSEEERRRLLKDVLEAGKFSWVDLEASRSFRGEEPLIETIRKMGVRILRSFHLFDALPGESAWNTALSHAAAAGDAALPDGIKAAVQVKSGADLLRLLRSGPAWHERMRLQGKKLVLVGMGDLGQPVRILPRRFGSAWTYASTGTEEIPAPGMLSAETLDTLYRSRAHTAQTEICGIIGNPLGQTRSPLLHNAWYRRDERDAVYLSFPLESLTGLSALMEEFPLQGLSVTVPYKERVLPLLSHRSAPVQAIGACNTLIRDGVQIRGENSDAPGFMVALRKRFPELDPARHKVSLIGAGGAARACLWALRQEGFAVLVLNRTAEKAEALAAELGAAAAPLTAASAERVAEYRDLIVQTGSAGMPPLEDVDPLAWYAFRGDERVYDIVYKPPVTKLMARAAAAGCETENGLGMLEAQAEVQYGMFRRVSGEAL